MLSSSSMAVSLNPLQQQLQKLAEGAVLLAGPQRVLSIEQMKVIIQQITLQQLIDVIKAIQSPVALRFLIPAGVYGDARNYLYNKLASIPKAPEPSKKARTG